MNAVKKKAGGLEDCPGPNPSEYFIQALSLAAGTLQPYGRRATTNDWKKEMKGPP